MYTNKNNGFTGETAAKNSLTLKSNCVCPGHSLIIAECTVKGRFSDTTVWEGSAVDCNSSRNEIILLHSLFGSNASIRADTECNNKSIQTQGTQVEGNYYTSQIY